jgi:AraC family transcriptional regulator of adaptative response / DNA-3-methyladenine glycosylase II
VRENLRNLNGPLAAGADIVNGAAGASGVDAAMPAAPLDPEQCWRAVTSRDRRFEGRFFMGVRTTGIYCRPGCPARMPARRNVSFYPTAAAAQRAGFRACLRCRPETVPGSAAAAGTSAIVARALRLIDAGALDEHSVEELAARVGITSRWLRQLFVARLGAGPLAVAKTRRTHLARRLIESSTLTTEEIAATTGFGSARRLRAALASAFGQPASALRKAPGRAAGDATLTLLLRSRGSLHIGRTLAFLAARAIPGVEVVEGALWRRTAATAAGMLIVEAAEAPEDAVRVSIRPPLAGSVSALIARITRVFDLDADAAAIAATLRRDAWLRARLGPDGVRIPGAWDAFEMGVRAIVGQQISVAAARTVLGRLVAICGEPLARPEAGLTHGFPAPAAMAAADLGAAGLTRARAATLRTFAGAVAHGRLDLSAALPLDESVARLTALPGIGDWTAHEIALRGFGDPDAFPAGDLILRRQLARGGQVPGEREVRRRAERWRPWRGYAAMALWTSAATESAGKSKKTRAKGSRR